MHVRDLGPVLRRRWHLALVCLLLTVGVGYAAQKQLPPTYETTASVVLLPPVQPDTTGENKLLGLGGLSQAVDVLIRATTAKDVRDQLEGDNPPATYDITPDFSSDAPLLLVTVKGDRAASKTLLASVLATIPRQLGQIQTSVATPEQWRISALTVTQDRTPEMLVKPKLRLVGVLSAATLALSILLLAALDGLLVRRRRRLDALGGAAPRRFRRGRGATNDPGSGNTNAPTDERDDSERAPDPTLAELRRTPSASASRTRTVSRLTTSTAPRSRKRAAQSRGVERGSKRRG